MDDHEDLIIAVQSLSAVRGRTDFEQSDNSTDAGGDVGGDGLNLPES